MSFSPDARGIHAHINMTPMIDVLLVLLIIFMVVAPTHPVGLPTTLPQPASASAPDDDPGVVAEVLADGSIRINSQPVSRDRLASTLSEIYRSRATRTLFIRGDGRLEFASIAGVIDEARSAGIDHFALLTARYDLR